MQLSLHSDYALRVLIYLGTHPGRKVSTREISDAFGISKHHLVRVVQTLGQHGYVHVMPGRAGGVTLAKEPEGIRLGNVIRDAEPDLRLVECFHRQTDTCPITPVCKLKLYLNDALNAFLDSLNEKSLADILAQGGFEDLAQVFVKIGAMKLGASAG
ncbi:MAG: Rrf2 family transcriptional regulator [Acidobacteriota bacterium]